MICDPKSTLEQRVMALKEARKIARDLNIDYDLFGLLMAAAYITNFYVDGSLPRLADWDRVMDAICKAAEIEDAIEEAKTAVKS